jgi:hypothetical protein
MPAAMAGARPFGQRNAGERRGDSPPDLPCVNDFALNPHQTGVTLPGALSLPPSGVRKQEVSMRSGTIIAALAATFILTTAAQAATVTANGRQVRALPGESGELHGRSFTLPAACTIASATGTDEAGFWIEGVRTVKFDTAAKAIGTAVPAGRYWVYPNIKTGAPSATVTVAFDCP